MQGPTTTTLVQRLRARAAGVRGNGADEAFIRRLAEELDVPSRGKAGSLSRSLRSFLARSDAGKQQWMSSAMVAGEREHKSYTNFENMTKTVRSLFEPKELDAPARAVCQREKQRGTARGPLFAASLKEWERQASLTDQQLRNLARAKPAAEERGQRMATEHSEARQALAPSSSSSSSSSSLSSSSSSSSFSSAAPTAPVPAVAAEGDVAWCAPARRPAKLHYRVDVGSHAVAKLCRPQDDLKASKAGYRQGDTVASWEATGLTWCSRCAALARRRQPQRSSAA